jgi:hypothetical protein
VARILNRGIGKFILVAKLRSQKKKVGKYLFTMYHTNFYYKVSVVQKQKDGNISM